MASVRETAWDARRAWAAKRPKRCDFENDPSSRCAEVGTDGDVVLRYYGAAKFALTPDEMDHLAAWWTGEPAGRFEGD